MTYSPVINGRTISRHSALNSRSDSVYRVRGHGYSGHRHVTDYTVNHHWSGSGTSGDTEEVAERA